MRLVVLKRYKGALTSCYRQVRKQNPGVPHVMGLRLRLSGQGKVRSLNFAAWDQKMDERFLDCLVRKVGRWRLPRFSGGLREANLRLDFSKM